jgi:hypothetical protein
MRQGNLPANAGPLVPRPCLAAIPSLYLALGRRSVAQPGRALLSGGRGRRFKSSHSDQRFPRNSLLLCRFARGDPRQQTAECCANRRYILARLSHAGFCRPRFVRAAEHATSRSELGSRRGKPPLWPHCTICSKSHAKRKAEQNQRLSETLVCALPPATVISAAALTTARWNRLCFVITSVAPPIRLSPDSMTTLLVEQNDAGHHHQGICEPFANMAPKSPSASPLIPSEK